ncbi:MAG TPA: DMT family transporter [Candidatus Limnocylindrales bacterium]
MHRPGATRGPAARVLAGLEAQPRLTALLGAMCIAFSGIFFRYSAVSPSTATVFRCLYALPLLALLAYRETGTHGPRSRRNHLVAIAAGVFFASDLTLYHHGVQQVGAGLGTVIPNLQVVIVAIAGWLFLGEHPDRRTWVAMPVAVVGVLLISGLLEHGAYGADPPLGVAFGLGAGASYAGYLLIIRQGNRDGRRPFGTLFDASAATVVVAGLAGLVVGDLDLVPSWPAHGWLLALALISQVAGYGLINLSLPRLPAVLTSVLLLAQPIATLVFSGLLLSEAPSALQLGGVALILGGVVLAAARRSSSPVAEGATEPA